MALLITGRITLKPLAPGLETDEVFLMGGIDKKRVLDISNPHLFFEDQMVHWANMAARTLSAHIPIGINN